MFLHHPIMRTFLMKTKSMDRRHAKTRFPMKSIMSAIRPSDPMILAAVYDAGIGACAKVTAGEAATITNSVPMIIVMASWKGRLTPIANIKSFCCRVK